MHMYMYSMDKTIYQLDIIQTYVFADQFKVTGLPTRNKRSYYRDAGKYRLTPYGHQGQGGSIKDQGINRIRMIIRTVGSQRYHLVIYRSR